MVFLFCLRCHVSDFIACGQVFARINFAKDTFSFGLTFFVNDWIVLQGPPHGFYVYGGITMGVCFLTIPLYIYGKQIRSSIYRHHLVD